MFNFKQNKNKSSQAENNNNQTGGQSDANQKKHLIDPVLLGFQCIENNYEDLLLLLLGVLSLEEKNKISALQVQILKFEKEQRLIYFDLKCVKKLQFLLEKFSSSHSSLFEKSKQQIDGLNFTLEEINKIKDSMLTKLKEVKDDAVDDYRMQLEHSDKFTDNSVMQCVLDEYVNDISRNYLDFEQKIVVLKDIHSIIEFYQLCQIQDQNLSNLKQKIIEDKHQYISDFESMRIDHENKIENLITRLLFKQNTILPTPFRAITGNKLREELGNYLNTLPVSAVDTQGDTLLHKATKLGRWPIATCLIAAGANPERPNRLHETPADSMGWLTTDALKQIIIANTFKNPSKFLYDIREFLELYEKRMKLRKSLMAFFGRLYTFFMNEEILEQRKKELIRLKKELENAFAIKVDDYFVKVAESLLRNAKKGMLDKSFLFDGLSPLLTRAHQEKAYSHITGLITVETRDDAVAEDFYTLRQERNTAMEDAELYKNKSAKLERERDDIKAERDDIKNERDEYRRANEKLQKRSLNIINYEDFDFDDDDKYDLALLGKFIDRLGNVNSADIRQNAWEGLKKAELHIHSHVIKKLLDELRNDNSLIAQESAERLVEAKVLSKKIKHILAFNSCDSDPQIKKRAETMLEKYTSLEIRTAKAKNRGFSTRSYASEHSNFSDAEYMSQEGFMGRKSRNNNNSSSSSSTSDNEFELKSSDSFAFQEYSAGEECRL